MDASVHSVPQQPRFSRLDRSGGPSHSGLGCCDIYAVQPEYIQGIFRFKRTCVKMVISAAVFIVMVAVDVKNEIRMYNGGLTFLPSILLQYFI